MTTTDRLRLVPENHDESAAVFRFDAGSTDRVTPAAHSSHVVGMGVDVTVDLDPTVEVDGSEAVRRRLTPAPTSTHVAAFDEGSQRSVGPRSTSTVDSTSYVAVKVNAVGSRTRSTSTITTARLAAGRRGPVMSDQVMAARCVLVGAAVNGRGWTILGGGRA